MIDSLKVIKRNGDRVNFEGSKIYLAINKAALKVKIYLTSENILEIVDSIKNFLVVENNYEEINVEFIQDTVEEKLMLTYPIIAKEYILYREQHKKQREFKNNFSSNMLEPYLNKSDWEINENSNTGYSLQGLNHYVSQKVTKEYWLDYVYDKKIKEAHDSGDLHIHDLGILAPYCIGLDLQDLLMSGFKGKYGVVESDPAKHFRTALGQIVNLTFSAQNECYDDKTEVLSNNGWKFFKDLLDGDYVATLNIKNHNFEFNKPIRYIEKNYEGLMRSFKNKMIDLVVTPDHNMLVSHYNPSLKKEDFKLGLVKAIDFNHNIHFIPKKSIWEGEEVCFFSLPAVTDGKGRVRIEKQIPMDTWLKFMGIFISEGSCYYRKGMGKRRGFRRKEYIINISQKKYVNEFKDVMDELGLKYSQSISKENCYSFKISNLQLYSYLSQFGVSKNKYIPRELLNLSKRQLSILYNFLMLGDGDTSRSARDNGNERYFTNSYMLASDVQELMIKLGNQASIQDKVKYVDGKEYRGYIVSKSKVVNYHFDKSSISDTFYSGKVFCVETENSTLLVRRNGKSAWCGNCAGAIAFSNFDTLLSPFIYYDNLSRDQVKQAIQEFLFNMNVSTRSGGQVPFSNITLDFKVPNFMEGQPVIIGGGLKDKVYSEFQNEIDLFNDVLFEVMVEGDAKERVFTFPIPTVNITKDFDYDNPALDNFWTAASKYGLPYFSNFVNSNMSPDDVRSMCCRLKISNKDLKRGGGLFGSNPLTGSINVTTLNLPRIGELAVNDIDFFDRLDKLLNITKDISEKKRKVLERYTADGLYPYLKFYLRGVKEKTGGYWSNHFSTVGIIGIHECCLNFLGKGVDTVEGKIFTESILDVILKKLKEFKEETGHLYNLEATPAEGTSHRLALKDKNKFGIKDIHFANSEVVNEDTVVYYTNSSQLPVGYTGDIFEILNHQDNLQVMYTGGSVVHLFMAEKMNADSLKKLVRVICDNYKLPYFSVTPTFSICKNHGYINGEVEKCSICGELTEIYSRIVGYLRPIKNWNVGKQLEFKERKYVI